MGAARFKCARTHTCMYVWGANFTLITVRRINPKYSPGSVQFSSVQLLSHVRLFATPWTTACQASLSITNSRSLLKLMSIELMMPSNHLILCCSLLLPSVFPRMRVFLMSQFFTSGGKVLEIQPQQQSFQLTLRTDFL